MRLPRSTFYAAPQEKPSDAELVAEIRAITDEFEFYGYRRVGAELRHRDLVVNAKKVRRLMREHESTTSTHGEDGASPAPPPVATAAPRRNSQPTIPVAGG